MSQNNSTSQNGSNFIMNYKQQHPTTQPKPNCNSITGNVTPAAGNSFLQRRTLFEGRVSGPMRFEELVKDHNYQEKEGDQEILHMDRNNLKLTFHKGGAQQNISPSESSIPNNFQARNTSVIQHQSNRKHQQMNFLEQQRQSETDRFAYYSQQHFGRVTAHVDSVANMSEMMSSRRESPQPPWTQQSNKGNDSLNTFNSTSGYRWSTEQMEVIPTNNVHSQAKIHLAHPLSQNYSAEYKVPMTNMRPVCSSDASSAITMHEAKNQLLYQNPNFIDQQLNNHLKSFKYIKQSQQQLTNVNQAGNSMLLAHHNNPSTFSSSYGSYVNLNSSSNTSATITKIPHIQYSPETSPEDGSIITHGPGHNHEAINVGTGNTKSVISALSTKSRPNFKQKQQIMQPQTTHTTPRAALEHYEKLRKYWDYQHHLLSEDQEYKNYCNPNNKIYSPHHESYGQEKSQPVEQVNWQHNRSNYTHGRGGTMLGTESVFDLSNYHQLSPQTNIYSTNNPHHKMQPVHPYPPTGTSGFAAELQKLQNYNFSVGQHNKRESGWPYHNRVTPPTPAQKKTYPNSNNYPDVPCQTLIQQFNQGTEIQRKWNSIVPRVPPASTAVQESSSESLLLRHSSIIRNADNADVEIVDCVGYTTQPTVLNRHNALKDFNKLSGKDKIMEVSKQETTDKKDTHSRLEVHTPTPTPTDLSLPRRRSDQDQHLWLSNRRFRQQSPPSPQRSKSVGGITDASGYDHIVLLDKRVMTYMCKRCLETLKSDQEIRNHLFCKMLQDSIQCHVCRNLYATKDYPEHLKAHGVRAFSN